ncbi:MAG: DegT/DnrJ/EryC1/StrS family aminotransferase [Bdellovibrionaceae bacterium]|nr:DegT/DnrJ/EryC1/StrS family aminotransferase [Pseudobdellovibrionaceae bacterium]
MSVQLFIPAFRVDECLEQIKECLEKGWTGLGFKTIEFEEAWKKYTGLSHAHFLNSNTSGLHLAVYMLKTKYGWQDGDEVITTPLTFVSTNHAIMYEDLKPVFADVDDSLCMSPESIEAKISPKTKAVIYVGIGGNTGRYEQVVAVCKKHGLKLILDAAHMAGTRIRGRHVGGEADVSVFSFQAVKNLPTADSGMICWNNKEDDERARKLCWLGINKDTYARTGRQGNYKWMYDVEEVGFKYHGNSIMAGIGMVQLKYLDKDNSHRRSLAQIYKKTLAGSEKIKLIEINPDCESSTHLFQIRVQNRDLLLQFLNEKEIFPGVHYRDNTEYAIYSHGKGTCPKATKASHEILSLPLHLKMNEEDALLVANEVLNFVNSGEVTLNEQKTF